MFQHVKFYSNEVLKVDFKTKRKTAVSKNTETAKGEQKLELQEFCTGVVLAKVKDSGGKQKIKRLA